MNRKRSYVLVLCIILIVPFSRSAAQTPDELFPLYDVIKPNVEFWTDIYSRYTTGQGVLHDNQELDRVYGVIDLEDPDQPGGHKINQVRIKNAKKYYRAILDRLAEGQAPQGFEEERIAQMFGPGATHKDYHRARYNIRCQVGQSDRFRAGVIRSGAYLDEIKRIFRHYGLPEDLAYLPHVESSFNPKAFSKFGAAGIWQFTRSTGKQYMSIGYAVDERRDPITSTYAAARYLKRNHDRLQNWPMAITAYNHGTSGMLRAKRARGTYEAIFKNHRSRLFKFASRNFYSEFLAARHVATNYRDYFGELELDRPPQLTEVRLEGFVSLPEIAQALDLDIETLHRLNPALRKPVLEGTKYIPKGFQLRLPRDDERRWDSLLTAQLPQLYKNAQTHSRFYTVRYGDTAGKIARRYGIRLNDLIAANRLDSRATIYVNQNLRIPHPGEQIPTQVAAVTPNTAAVAGKATTAVAKPPAKPVVIARSSPVPPLNAQPSITSQSPQPRPVAVQSEQAPTTEQAGDSTLARADTDAGRPAPNRTNGPSVPLGKMVVAAAAIPRSDKPPIQLVDSWQIREMPAKTAASNPEIVTGRIAVEQMIESEGGPIGIIHVEVEETLGHYAEWAGVRAQDLRRLNRLQYGRMIHIGQRLKIPLHRVDKETFEEIRYEYHKGLAEDFFSAYRVAGVQSYTIKRGDNIWTLSRENFELPMWLIQRYNTDVDLHSLMPSQKLMIPVVEENA